MKGQHSRFRGLAGLFKGLGARSKCQGVRHSFLAVTPALWGSFMGAFSHTFACAPLSMRLERLMAEMGVLSADLVRPLIV